MDERKTRADSINGFKNVLGPQPNQPLTPVEKMKRELKSLIERGRQETERRKAEVDLQILQIHGMVAAMRDALPVLDRVVGDPSQNLAELSQLILQRGCDVAERVTEITLDPEA